ncbi:RluA family pseudouridine synthase, partial [Phreatobacter sp. AB_2022a]|uniref:RluA family pseudouridine synthase n=1 Tax=Phreatobacter sp. AB_2022a TaxID=3003134 RepID=UPI003FA707C1
GSPRRRRDRDWDIGDDGGWAPEADLDLADVTEPRDAPRRRAGEGVRRDDRAERPPRDRDGMARGPRRSEKPQVQPAAPTRRELKAAATETLQTGVQTLTVTGDEDDMRVDRFLAARFPQLSFSYIQRIVRKGELRVNGKRVETKDRLEQGQAVRVPPLKLDQPRPVSAKAGEDTKSFLASITLYEDSDVVVFAKPAGLAVQGGSGTKKHLDGMLAVLTDAEGQRPRLVHRLDKDTSGCILVAKSRFAAAALAKTFRTRAARKIYWAVVAGVPKPRQGRISTYLAKEEREDESRMRLAKHGEKGASHAVSYYAAIDTMAQKLSWLSMKPVTGRTHQLRVHAAEIGHPIIGDPKYFDVQNWEIPGGLQNKLHLHARRLVVPHPRGKGTIDVSAPLPPHMEQTFNLLGWDVSRYDPIVEAPEE